MLYTPIALEDIFAEPCQERETSFVERMVAGRLCLVRRSPDGLMRLERLLSTDARDYWDPRFQPNSLVD